MINFKHIIKRVLIGISAAGLFLLIAILIIDYSIESSSAQDVYDDVKNIPYNRVGLVLGTSKYLVGDYANPFFYNRINAAATLFEAGKIDYIIVSGDNSLSYYNEPRDMKKALLNLGVPEDKIYLDYAGFRTFDSVIRCMKVFGQNRFTVISQKFQNERAIYIAQNKGADVIGYNADDIDSYLGKSIQMREYFARVKVFLDLYIIDQKPKFLGKKINIE
ncbi:MAG: YdcF family protein [Candidatus Kapabacteria bacterium]|nr:YdcF family protein [Candidatus Kapabacteria bacterium]